MPTSSKTPGSALPDGDVVEHRDRLGADADQVVDVHRDAVDPDGVVAVHHLGDEQLRADAVGRDREAEPAAEVEHVRVVPEPADGPPGRPSRRLSVLLTDAARRPSALLAAPVSTPAVVYSEEGSPIG